MSHRLRYDPDIDCVVLRVDGVVTLALIAKIAPEVARMCEETGCHRVLNDMTAATIDVSVPEVYESPGVMDSSGISRKIKRALVVPPSFRESDFLETVTRNRGHNLMVFEDIAEATEWLLRDE